MPTTLLATPISHRDASPTHTNGWSGVRCPKPMSLVYTVLSLNIINLFTHEFEAVHNQFFRRRSHQRPPDSQQTYRPRYDRQKAMAKAQIANTGLIKSATGRFGCTTYSGYLAICPQRRPNSLHHTSSTLSALKFHGKRHSII